MGGDLVPGREGCEGYLKPAGDGGGAMFVGKTIKRVMFNTTRGGEVPGDDLYRVYVTSVAFHTVLMAAVRKGTLVKWWSD